MRRRWIVALVLVTAIAFSLVVGYRVLQDDDGDDEERVAVAVSELYRDWSDGDYDAVWSLYTSDFQKRCSFDDFVDVLEESRRSEGWGELLPTQIRVAVVDDRAVADYVVIRTSPEGFAISEYDYRIIYVYEGGEWRAEEPCLDPPGS